MNRTDKKQNAQGDMASQASQYSEGTPLKPGVFIPGVGEISKVESFVSLTEKLLGKRHKYMNALKLSTTSGTVFKAVQDFRSSNHKPGETGTRNDRVVEYLSSFTSDTAVPAVRYHDAGLIVLEYIPGTTLDGPRMTIELAERLGRFIAAAQPPTTLSNGKLLPFSTLIAELEASATPLSTPLSESEIRDARFPLDANCPAGLCFSDAALKNYVERPDGSLAYVDVYGVLPRLVGLILVRQTLALPEAHRRAFIHAYLSASPYADHIREFFPQYCRYYIVQRTLRLLAGHSAAGRTKLRKLRRAKSARLFHELVKPSLELPPRFDEFRNWIERIEV